MAANKTQPTKITVKSFIESLTDENKRADAKMLVRLMESITHEKPKMWGPSIIGFGTHHYVYESGREGDMPLACFSPRKAAIVLYQLTGLPHSETLLAKIGKHTRGKGCVYVKKLADLDLKTLETLITASVAAITK